MDFDEYDYLEKAVEDTDDRDSDKKRKELTEKSERTYRKHDIEDEVDGSDRKSKRSRGDEQNGTKKDRERDRDRDRERERSGRDKDRHRSSSGRDRDGEREKDIERDRSSREKDRDRESERDRDRDREKEKREKEKDKEREREKRDSRDRDREREKERERREKEREERERSRRSRSRSERDRERERDLEMRDGRRREKKEAVEPEADPERDQRTVFAYQMPLKATERDVYEFFSKAGKVRDVRLIMDRNSRRSKGVGFFLSQQHHIKKHLLGLGGSCGARSAWPALRSYPSKETELELSALESVLPCISLLHAFYIEFFDAMAVPMAIALSGQLLLGQPVMVKPSEAEKNLVQSNASSGAAGNAGQYGAVDRKLYVGNLHFNMTDTQLKEIFEAFGKVEAVQLPLDAETGHCKGFGFVQFANLEDAKAAQSLNGKLEIAGRTIKVSSVTDHVGTQDTNVKSADFDDDEGGLALNAHSRAMLMAKLDRSGTATSIAGGIAVPGLNGASPTPPVILPIIGQPPVNVPVLSTPIQPNPVVEPVGTPSECLLLKNMFDPTTEMEPDFDVDIKDDVEEECSKFGRVKHIYVEKDSPGYVYLRFETVQAASAAQQAMHNRWFARRSISALFIPPQLYEAKFKG